MPLTLIHNWERILALSVKPGIRHLASIGYSDENILFRVQISPEEF